MAAATGKNRHFRLTLMSKKKAAVEAHGPTKAAKKKKRGKVRKLSIRQTKLLKGVVEGKSVLQAALAAGYSEHTAEHASVLLSTEAMRHELQRRIPLDKIIQRVNEGMDAMRSDSFVIGSKLKGDERIESIDSIDYGERRQAAALAAKLVGADPASKFEIKGDVNNFIRVEFIDVAAQESA